MLRNEGLTEYIIEALNEHRSEIDSRHMTHYAIKKVVEIAEINYFLDLHNGNQTAAAYDMGIARATLGAKLNQYDIESKRGKRIPPKAFRK